MRVDVFFTDEAGRRWRVYDWSVISGHKYRRRPGEQCAEYRGFIDESTGERRVYRFPTESAPRLFSLFLLSEQLAQARVLEEQPPGLPTDEAKIRAGWPGTFQPTCRATRR
jgi:hypothetical protein